MSLEVPLASMHFVWALATISRLRRVPFASELLTQQFPPPHTATTLVQAASALGFDAERRRANAANDIRNIPLPCLALLKPAAARPKVEDRGDAQAPGVDDSETKAHSLALVVKVDRRRIVMFEPGAVSGTTLTPEDCGARYAGELIVFARQPESPADADAIASRSASFGFSWFVLELLKHKRIWRDVLLASFAIQLVALATPILTQIVLDKVEVHQTLNTLAVIGVALAVFLVFNAGMSWIRQQDRKGTGPARPAVQHREPQGDDHPSQQAHRPDHLELPSAVAERAGRRRSTVSQAAAGLGQAIASSRVAGTEGAAGRDRKGPRDAHARRGPRAGHGSDDARARRRRTPGGSLGDASRCGAGRAGALRQAEAHRLPVPALRHARRQGQARQSGCERAAGFQKREKLRHPRSGGERFSRSDRIIRTRASHPRQAVSPFAGHAGQRRNQPRYAHGAAVPSVADSKDLA